MKNNIKSSLFTLLLLILLPIIGSATHIVGGDITYKKLSDDPVKKTSKFLITMNLRRDCFLGAANADFDKNAKIRIFRSNGSIFLETTMPFMADDTLNNYVQSDCGFEGTQVCVHETRYLKIVDLPLYEGGYTIAYQRCCRNGSINNIIDPLETGATYSVNIPKEAFTSNNSSPSFKQWPAVYICAGVQLDFDNSALDSDGDSLVYKLCTPKIGLTRPEPEGFPSTPPYTDLVWKAPFGLNNLMGGTPLIIDTKTGRMTAIPNAVGQYVIGVCVEEWRGGKKIGEIRRDFQYNVRVCSPPPTAVFNAPSNLCNEKTVVFENKSTVANTYQWNFNFPSTDPTFLSTVKDPTFTFPANGTYQVKLTVIRNSDNCRDEEIKTIKITDLPYIADFDYEIKACNPDGTIIAVLTDKSSTADVGAVSTKWNWVLTQGAKTQTSTTNPAEFIIDPTDFSVNFNVEASNACNGSVSRNVVFNTKVFESDFKVELAGCDENNNLQIKLIDLSQELNDNYIVVDRVWIVEYPDTQIQLFGNNVTVSIPRTNYTVTLYVNTNKNCRNQLTKDFVLTDFIPSVNFDFSLDGCDLQNQAIIKLQETSNDVVNYAAVTDYVWSIKNETLTGQNINYITTLRDSFEAKLILKFANNCTNEISKIISVNQLRPKVQFSYEASNCPDDEHVNLIFKYETAGNQGLNNKGINWVIGNATNLQNYTDNSVMVKLPKDSLILGTIRTEFENGCVDEVSKNFIPGPYATLKLISDSLVLCPNEKKQLITGGNPLFTYTWTPSIGIDITVPSNPTITGVQDQVYEVIVSDGLCSVKGNVNVDVLESISLGISGENFTCDGSVNLKVDGAVGPGIYTWSTDAGGNNQVGVGSILNVNQTKLEETYYVNFKGEVCSANPAEIKVVNQTPRFDIATPYTFCRKDTIETNSIINLVAEHVNSITWEPNPHIISGANTLKPVVTTINDTETEFYLYFNAVNQYGCDHRDSLKIEIVKNPVVDFDFNVKDCNNNEVCFKLKNIDGQVDGFVKYVYGSGNSQALGPENCFTYPSEGEYKVVLSNLVKRCPFKSVEKTIKLNAEFPVFDNDKAEDCINSDYSLTLPNKANGRPFVWQDKLGNVISTEANPKVDIKSDTFFILNVKDDNGCAFNDTFSVKAFVYDMTLKIDEEVCAYGIYQINSTINPGINFTYNWTPANAIVSGGNTANPTVDIAKSSNYKVKVTHPSLGCENEEEVTFKIFNFNYELDTPDVFCLNKTVQPIITVQGNLNYIYEWTPKDIIVSGGNTSNPTLEVEDNDKVVVKVTHPTLGCVLRDSFIIDPTSLTLSVQAQPDGDVAKGQTVEISIVNPNNDWIYEWSNNFTGTKQNVKIDEETIFVVTATDKNGCTGTAELVKKIRPPQCTEDVFVPTAFSPNQDGTNDVLFVRSNYIDELEFIIYNRWGQEVFSSKDIKNGWDGKLLGEELSPDVYAYWLKAKCSDGEEILKRGNVSLLR